MERVKERSLSERLRRADKDVKKIKWEDFDNELTRILSLSSALEEATERKRNLQQKLEPLIQVFFSYSRFIFSTCMSLINYRKMYIAYYIVRTIALSWTYGLQISCLETF